MNDLEYELNTAEQTIDWFLDTVLVRDIKTVIEAGAGYLAFSLIAQAIEVLGALLDEDEFHDLGLSEARFGKAIDELFVFRKDYARYNRVDSDYYLWRNLRCGMAHVLRPQTRLLFTGRADARKLNFSHLSIVQPAGYAQPQLLLVIEDFHDDLAEACRRVKNIIKRKTHPKLKQGYITISVYKHSFSNDGDKLKLDVPIGASLNIQTSTLSGGSIMQAFVTGQKP